MEQEEEGGPLALQDELRQVLNPAVYQEIKKVISSTRGRERSVMGAKGVWLFCCRLPVYIEEKALNTLAYLCDGDARTGLNGLQLAVQARIAVGKTIPLNTTAKGGAADGILVTEEHVKEGLQRSHILYDRAGEYQMQFLRCSVLKMR